MSFLKFFPSTLQFLIQEIYMNEFKDQKNEISAEITSLTANNDKTKHKTKHKKKQIINQ